MVDLATLLVVTIFATALSGVLLTYAWATNRHTPALALWAVGYLIAAVGLAMILARGQIANVWTIDVANALVIAAYGIIWMGARQFNNRRTPMVYVLIGPAIWLLAYQLEAFYASMPARVVLVSFLLLCYTVLTGYEFWCCNRKLSSAWPLIVILGLHAALFGSRVLWPGWMVLALTGSSNPLSVVALFSFELLFHSLCAAFLLAFLAKERRELYYRQESMIDPLTGIWNRRAFLDGAMRKLNRAAVEGTSVAVIAFDLDRFKSINDRYGHLAGDRILLGVSAAVSEALRPGDLFARMGGEEFALLLADLQAADAAVVVERLRQRIAALAIDFDTSRLRTTASFGVAIARPQTDLEALMAAADHALYRAKELGRNRIEFATAMSVVTDRGSVPSRYVRTRLR
jgi:diguanylate cyclase (GGDEF)-like protein